MPLFVPSLCLPIGRQSMASTKSTISERLEKLRRKVRLQSSATQKGAADTSNQLEFADTGAIVHPPEDNTVSEEEVFQHASPVDSRRRDSPDDPPSYTCGRGKSVGAPPSVSSSPSLKNDPPSSSSAHPAGTESFGHAPAHQHTGHGNKTDTSKATGSSAPPVTPSFWSVM